MLRGFDLKGWRPTPYPPDRRQHETYVRSRRPGRNVVLVYYFHGDWGGQVEEAFAHPDLAIAFAEQRRAEWGNLFDPQWICDSQSVCYPPDDW